jgi:serine/threonine protein kinase
LIPVRAIAERWAEVGDEPRTATYRRITELASGGMGKVELCVRRSGTFSRLYAVKRLHPHMRDDASMRSMFLDEARVAGLVRHVNVVSVLDLGEDAEGPFLVMDYVEGVSLSRFVRQHAATGELLPVSLCAHIVAQIARGLHAAHELVGPDGVPLHLVHRDVSPQNVLVGHDGIVRVTDFGIAKALGRSTHTNTGLLKGKVGYMSPEQLRFESIDRRSDLFALGVLMFELLTTRRLYRGDDAAEVARSILHEPPPDLGDERPDVSPALVELQFRLLAKNREDRPADAAEVAACLEDATAEDGPVDLAGWVQARFAEELSARRLEIQTRLADPPQDVAVDARDSIEAAVTHPVLAPRQARARGRVVALGGAVLVASALAAFVLTRSRADSSIAAPSPDRITVHVESRPPGATVHVGDRAHGVTPSRIDLPRGEAAIVRLELAGHETAEHELAATQDERLVISLVPEPEPVPLPVEPERAASPIATPPSAPPSAVAEAARKPKRRRTTEAAPPAPEPAETRPRFRRFD